MEVTRDGWNPDSVALKQINLKDIEDECRLLKCAKRSDSVHAAVLEDAIVTRLF
jgi:hypothetical protein